MSFKPPSSLAQISPIKLPDHYNFQLEDVRAQNLIYALISLKVTISLFQNGKTLWGHRVRFEYKGYHNSWYFWEP